MTDRYDVAVVGGGIGGATAACHVSPHGSLVLLEQEAELAYHTTSRSAAVYLEGDGGWILHRLNRGAREFLDTAHAELDAPLLDPMPVLNVGTASMHDEMRAQAERDSELTPAIRYLEGAEVLEWCPVLDPEVVTCAVVEPTAAALDVMALHQLYVRRARAAGADIRRDARVTAIAKTESGWRLDTASGAIECGVIVNAAGAWGDGVADLAGVQPVGLTPMRRTAFTTRIDHDPTGWPLIYSQSSELHCYFKPEAGNQLLCSLADETPSAAVDAKPEEIDVAQAIENINAISTLNIRSVATTWAGLRTFAPDRDPVFGWDDGVDGFFWMVGQGGWGIVSSPSAGRIAAAAIAGTDFPADLAATGLTFEHLTPRR
ncbi:MAG: FAD-dependent oxidoreductase [Actinomycetota bacterium]